MPPQNCSAVLDGQLYANSRRHWSSTSAVCHSVEVDCTVLPTEQFRSSAFCCCRPVGLIFAAWQPSWPTAESQHFQTSTEGIHFYEILTTKSTKRIRDFLSKRYINLHLIYLLTYITQVTYSHTFRSMILSMDSTHFFIALPLTELRKALSLFSKSKLHSKSYQCWSTQCLTTFNTLQSPQHQLLQHGNIYQLYTYDDL